jgi:hypothetical protein
MITSGTFIGLIMFLPRRYGPIDRRIGDQVGQLVFTSVRIASRPNNLAIDMIALLTISRASSSV